MAEEDKREEISHLESRLAELEKMAGELEKLPDEKLPGELERALSLLGEINNDLEKGLTAAERESAEAQRNLEGRDLSSLDAEMEE